MFHRLRHWLEKKSAAAATAALQPCAHPGCSEKGPYRAPKSRQLVESNHSKDWFWFCLAHVRQYNASWNYYANMSETEVESDIRSNNTWQRPSWPLGRGSDAVNRLRQAPLLDPFDLIQEGPPQKPSLPPTLKTQERQALALMDLGYPFTVPELRQAYRALVKKHHPDANNGCRVAEEKIKQINEAYTILKKIHS